MNHILFKVAEIEERLRMTLEMGGPIDRIVSEAQLKTLDFFKYHPIRNQEEANELLRVMDLVFGLK
ncbi:hypothetical protein J0J80_07330 [Turicibacter bilis]|uniref:hypothetical protein n=1 Tax=Turicibacter bilis TaxID=2735723 RepID=UPI001BB06B6D|nr:hypothetical protein [Turicibacter bilis]MBS3203245.1 hypothetical protein [Turicibacter bilis]UUF09865.1 hypothetical protein J0J80_07330 [Turicibacter bilis]